MWNKITQAAGYVAGSIETDEESKPADPTKDDDAQEQLNQQILINEQLKLLLRKNEDQQKEKEKQFAELQAKFQRHQIQSKAKIANLTSQLNEKTSKKEEGDFDDNSSSDSSDYGSRGKILLLKKQLETSKQQMESKDKEIIDITSRFETRIRDLEFQLQEKQQSESQFVQIGDSGESVEESTTQVSDIHEMYAQMVYKDAKILDLTNHISELELKIIDLQEHAKEKDEVLQARNLAVQLMSADMNRKGKTVVDELEETREQMKLMQSNFSDMEQQWKAEREKLSVEIAELRERSQSELSEKDSLVTNLDLALKKAEAARFELVTKNAELQKKVVLYEESVKNEVASHRKKCDEELAGARKLLEQEQSKLTELKKALHDATAESESKILKARVKERTKLKSLERELAALKNLQTTEEKPGEISQLQQQVALLEEEKGTLQLRLMEVDEQISVQETLRSENDHLLTGLKENEEKFGKLKDVVENLEDERNTLSVKVAEQENLLDMSNKTQEETREQNLSLLRDLQGLELVKGDLENQTNTLEEQVKSISNKNKELTEEIGLHKQDKISLDIRIIELEELREGYERSKAELRMKMEAMEESFMRTTEHDLKEQIQELETKCRELEQSLNSSTQRSNEVEKQSMELSEELASVKSQFDQATSENQKLEDSLFQLKIQYEDAVNSKDKLQLEFTEISSATEKLQNSVNTILKSVQLENASEFPSFWQQHINEVDETNAKLLTKLQNITESKDIIISEFETHSQNLEEEIQKQKTSFKEAQDDWQAILEQQMLLTSELESSQLEKDKLIEQLKHTLQQNENAVNKLNETIKNKMQGQAVLEEEKNFSQKQVQELNEKLLNDASKTEMKIQSLADQIFDLESEIASLNRKLKMKAVTEEDLQQDLTNMRAELENYIKTFTEREKSYKNERDEKNILVASLQEHLKVLDGMDKVQKDSIQKYEKELEMKSNDFVNRVAELQEIITVQEQDMGRLKEEIVSKDDYIKEVNATIASLRSSLESAMEGYAKEMEQNKTTIAELSEELRLSQQQVSVLQNTISTSQLNSTEEKNLNKLLFEDKTRLEFENKQLRDQLESSKFSMHEALEEVENLKSSSDILNKQNKELENSVVNLQDTIADSEGLKSQIRELLQDVQQLENVLHSSQLNLQQKEEEMAILEQELLTQKETLLSKQGEVDKLLSVLETTNKDNKELKRDLEEKIQEVEDLKMSTSSLKAEAIAKEQEVVVEHDRLSMKLSDQSSQLQNDMQQLQDLNSQLKLENARIIEEYAEFQRMQGADIQELADKVTGFEELCGSQHDSAIVQIDNMCSRIQKLSTYKENIQNLYVSRSDHEKMLKQLSESYDQERESQGNLLMKNIASREDDIRGEMSEAKKELIEKSELIVKLRKEIDRLNSNNETLNCQVSELGGYHDNMKTKFQTMTDAFASHKNDLNDLREFQEFQIYEHQQCMTSVNAELGKITEKVKDSLKTSEDNERLHHSLEDAHDDYKFLEDKYGHLQAEFQKLNETLASEIDDKKKSFEKYEMQILGFNKDIESLKLELGRCVAEKDAAIGEACGLKTLIESHDENVSAIKNFLLELHSKLHSDSMTDVPLSPRHSHLFDQGFYDAAKCLETSITNSIGMKFDLCNQLSTFQGRFSGFRKQLVDFCDMISISEIPELSFVKEEILLLLKKVESSTCDKSGDAQFVKQAKVKPSIMSRAEETFQKSAVDPESNRESSVKAKRDKLLEHNKSTQVQINKLTAEVQKLNFSNQELNSEISRLQNNTHTANEKCQKLLEQDGRNKSKISDLETHFSEMKKRNETLQLDHNSLLEELQSLRSKHKQKIKEFSVLEGKEVFLQDEVEKNLLSIKSLQNTLADLKLKFDIVSDEKTQLESKMANLQEHADMAMSDNDHYQSVVEKLNQSNTHLHDQLQKSNQCYVIEINQLKNLHAQEIQTKTDAGQKLIEEQSVLQNKSTTLQKKLDETVQKATALKKKNVSLMSELEQLAKKEPTLEESKHTTTEVMTDTVGLQMDHDVEREIKQYKLKIDALKYDLQVAEDTIRKVALSEDRWRDEYSRMEVYYKQAISDYQRKLNFPETTITMEPLAKELKETNARLEAELNQTLGSLHKQNAKYQELSIDVLQLMEERTFLKRKLKEFNVHVEDFKVRLIEEPLVRSSEPSDSIKIDMSTDTEKTPHGQDIAALHKRLLESEKTCQELRKANAALDTSLMAEREQRQLVEEELGFVQKQLRPMDSGSPNEYRLLLDDLDEPEMLIDRNVSISRKVRTHAYRVRRWVQRKRLYLNQACLRKKYTRMIYGCYIVFMHLWLLMCLVRHS